MIVFCMAVHNRAATCLPALEALCLAGEHSEDKSYRLNLLDWNSVDCDYEKAVQTLPYDVNLKVVSSHLNPPARFNRGEARQRALEINPPAREDTVFFLDADMLVPSGFCKLIEANVSVGTCFFPVCYSLHQGKLAAVKGHNSKRTSSANGWWRHKGYGNCGFNAHDFEVLGGWDEQFGPDWGGEDFALFRQAKGLLKVGRKRVQGLFHQWHQPDPSVQAAKAKMGGRTRVIRRKKMGPITPLDLELAAMLGNRAPHLVNDVADLITRFRPAFSREKFLEAAQPKEPAGPRASQLEL